MPKKINHKHFTLDDRIQIQISLECGMTFRAIARRIGRHETSVSREVKKHLRIQKTNAVKKDKDGKVINSMCKSLLKSPFCCNPCKRRHIVCAFDKHIYCAKSAQKEYEKLLVSAREGIPPSPPGNSLPPSVLPPRRFCGGRSSN